MNYDDAIGLIVRYHDGCPARFGEVRAANAAGVVAVDARGRVTHVPWAAVDRLLPRAFIHLLHGALEEEDNDDSK